ncbi:MAG: recombinase family protein [Candidatus Latescibacterota bacterium]
MVAEHRPMQSRRPLRIYAEQRGFDVVAEFVDTASGVTKSRPELDRSMPAGEYP